MLAIYAKLGGRKQRTEIVKPREAGLFLNHSKNEQKPSHVSSG